MDESTLHGELLQIPSLSEKISFQNFGSNDDGAAVGSARMLSFGMVFEKVLISTFPEKSVLLLVGKFLSYPRVG